MAAPHGCVATPSIISDAIHVIGDVIHAQVHGLSGMAAALATTTATSPLWMLKTRLQLTRTVGKSGWRACIDESSLLIGAQVSATPLTAPERSTLPTGSRASTGASPHLMLARHNTAISL